jgi:RNA polymerase sigma-70 factor, ECF subfamily
VSTVDESGLAALLRAALGGDEAAYASFLRQVASLVRPLAQHKLGAGRIADPEDVVQETLLAIHLKRHTWRQDEPVTPWVYAIARYKIVDVHRRRGRRIEVDIDDYANTLQAQAAERASEREIGRALAGIAEGQRKVVAAITVDGRSISETARLLGMKETAVRVALHRGLAAIATRFGRSGT